MIKFSKYQGTGNDFIMIDNRSEEHVFKGELVARLCHRRFGIGADGLILLQNHHESDFEMIYFNSDGNLGSMCGNGGRCIVSFANSCGITKDEYCFKASDGTHQALIKRGNPDNVKLKMKDVSQIAKRVDLWFADTGSPHVVIKMDKIDELDLIKVGREIRYSDEFAEEGVNVNVTEVRNSILAVRTYERGVENETFSCGTGVTAVSLIAVRNKWIIPSGNFVDIDTPGGSLRVHFKEEQNRFTDIWLEGPAALVYTGEFDADDLSHRIVIK
ncbi:MAG: diaminopimelate epimerase [Bacteroidetes bacterium]|nr:MAG: diaminopimelate epimerase [Bacteroidota bacterium]REK08187.1 MAG: diaminopimelate epimerase [Bacteroidota bacterium]REK32392.1 MAG: diaminopimelate epimerase [Bacteroidota bacterium]REK47444.1 MAG: diaminopimelate epimerase [Bacteroidota bacterium]